MKKIPPVPPNMPPVDIEKMIANPQAHQTELKMQNDELRRTRLALEEAHDKYSDLFDFAPIGYFTFDDQGVISEVNHTGASMLRLGKGAIIGQLFSNFIDSRDQDIFCLQRRKIIHSEERHNFELRLVRGDGTRLYVEMKCVPVTNQISAAVMDITERTQTREALRKENREITLANRILLVFAEEADEDVFDKSLALVQEGMASRHGVFGYISETGHLICPSLSKMLDACEVEGKCIHYPPEEWKGLWARALREKRSFFSNEASPVPPGHPIIHNNLASPILFRASRSAC